MVIFHIKFKFKCCPGAASQCDASNRFLPVNKWPENENTYLVGDIKRWTKYRPTNDRSLNYTELIEDRTIYEMSRLLEDDRMLVNNSKFSTVNISIGEFFSSRSDDARSMFSKDSSEKPTTALTSAKLKTSSTMAEQRSTPVQHQSARTGKFDRIHRNYYHH